MLSIKTKYLVSLLVFAQTLSCIASVQKKIDEIISRKDQSRVNFSIMVLDAQTGSSVYSHNPSTPLTPASNMKLVTTFTSLKKLGEDYQFKTKAGLLDNKLVVIGSGDPLLGLAGKDFIGQIVQALKDKGIENLDSVIIDSSVFDTQRINPNWPRAELNRSYSCEISGLNYNANCVKISASKIGNQITLTKVPDTSFLQLINNVRLTSKGDNAIGSNRTERENVITAYGKCKSTASFDVAIEDPALFFGYLLSERLNAAGIKIKNPLTAVSANPQNLEVIVEFSTPIMEVIQNCNKDSLNIAAECLLKTLAAQTVTGGKAGSWQAGRKVVDDYLASLGVNKAEFYIDDGSGLSSVNKLSANAITKILLAAYRSQYWPLFKQTLAVGGIDGTIKKQFYKDKYRSRVYAKSGYINGVRALSGVCTASNSGREYIFSIIANNTNYQTKKARTDIVEAIIDGE